MLAQRHNVGKRHFAVRYAALGWKRSFDQHAFLDERFRDVGSRKGAQDIIEHSLRGLCREIIAARRARQAKNPVILVRSGKADHNVREVMNLTPLTSRWHHIGLDALKLRRANTPKLFPRSHCHVGRKHKSFSSDHFVVRPERVRNDERVVRSQFKRKKMLPEPLSTESPIYLYFLARKRRSRGKRAVNQAIASLDCRLSARNGRKCERGRQDRGQQEFANVFAHLHIMPPLCSVSNRSLTDRLPPVDQGIA
jgi:hypothetical protein